MRKEENTTQNAAEGLGDSIARFTELTGIDKAVSGITKTLGMEDCGCKARQKRLNELFPYKTDK